MKATTLKKAAIFAGSLSLLAGSAFSQTAVSGAGGYTTETLLGDNTFNLLGITLHSPVSTSGTFDGSTADSLTDSAATYALDAGTSYLVEITGGAADGTVIEILGSQAAGDTISGLSGITADFQDTYNIRATATLADIFGAANEAGLQDGTSSTADLIWVPDGAGSFNQYFYSNGSFPLTAGWRQVGAGNTDQAGASLNYIDGILVQKKSAGSLPLVITGMVKTDNTSLPISDTLGAGFNYCGAAYPVGVTLDNSNIASFASDGTSSTADIIWMPDGAGSFNQFFVSNGSFPLTAGWRQVGAGNDDKAGEAVTSGFILQRKSGGPVNGLVTPPPFYASL